MLPELFDCQTEAGLPDKALTAELAEVISKFLKAAHPESDRIRRSWKNRDGNGTVPVRPRIRAGTTDPRRSAINLPSTGLCFQQSDLLKISTTPRSACEPAGASNAFLIDDVQPARPFALHGVPEFLVVLVVD